MSLYTLEQKKGKKVTHFKSEPLRSAHPLKNKYTHKYITTAFHSRKYSRWCSFKNRMLAWQRDTNPWIVLLEFLKVPFNKEMSPGKHFVDYLKHNKYNQLTSTALESSVNIVAFHLTWIMPTEPGWAWKGGGVAVLSELCTSLGLGDFKIIASSSMPTRL